MCPLPTCSYPRYPSSRVPPLPILMTACPEPNSAKRFKAKGDGRTDDSGGWLRCMRHSRYRWMGYACPVLAARTVTLPPLPTRHAAGASPGQGPYRAAYPACCWDLPSLPAYSPAAAASLAVPRPPLLSRPRPSDNSRRPLCAVAAAAAAAAGALLAANAKLGFIYLPPGSYRIRKSVTLTRPVVAGGCRPPPPRTSLLPSHQQQLHHRAQRSTARVHWCVCHQPSPRASRQHTQQAAAAPAGLALKPPEFHNSLARAAGVGAQFLIDKGISLTLNQRPHKWDTSSPLFSGPGKCSPPFRTGLLA